MTDSRILGSRCKSRDRLAHDLPHTASLARLLAHATTALPGRPSLNIRPRPAPSAAWGGRHQSTTSRPPGRAGVFNPDARVPEDRNRGSGFRSEGTPPYEKHPTPAEEHALCPHPLFIHCKGRALRLHNKAPARTAFTDLGKQGGGGAATPFAAPAGRWVGRGGFIRIQSRDPDVEVQAFSSEETLPSGDIQTRAEGHAPCHILFHQLQRACASASNQNSTAARPNDESVILFGVVVAEIVVSGSTEQAKGRVCSHATACDARGIPLCHSDAMDVLPGRESYGYIHRRGPPRQGMPGH
jgi:hypothetical protein